MAKSGAELRREQIREKFFPDDDLWTSLKEIGWFPAPRTLPLILSLIDSKTVSGSKSVSLVYLELLSRHRSDGVIEMSTEADHAFAAGYQGTRGRRTWQERMKHLEKIGFIRIQKVGNEAYKYVAIVHPTTAVQHLRDNKMVSDDWWHAYFARKLETKERSHEDRMKKLAAEAKVISITTTAPKKVKTAKVVGKKRR